MSSLDFVGNNPGAVRHGNFINYYQFHPADERLKGFPTTLWKIEDGGIFSCLDVGCNSGEMTLALWKFITADGKFETNSSEVDEGDKVVEIPANINNNCVILGIDLDERLISRAIESNPIKDYISYVTCNFMNEDEIRDAVTNFHLDGSQEVGIHQRFDAVFLFSVIMWIHLNHGDSGFKKLLRSAAYLSKNLLVVEPQRWKCYLSANRRCTRSGGEGFSLLSELQIRGDEAIQNEIDKVLTECGFQKITSSEESKWKRKTLFYQRCLNGSFERTSKKTSDIAFQFFS